MIRAYVYAFIIVSLFIYSVPFGQYSTSVATSTATTTFNLTAIVSYPEDEDPPAGGGGGAVIPPTELLIEGVGYPSRPMTLLKDAQYFAEEDADVSADFIFLFNTFVAGVYQFSVYGTDIFGIDSDSVTFSVEVISQARTTVSGVVVPPTITTDTLRVDEGEDITFYGQSYQDSVIVFDLIGVSSTTVGTNISGLYQYTLDTTGLDTGEYFVRVKMIDPLAESDYSQPFLFTVGEEIPPPFIFGDVNYDNRVDIVDFSITAFWYKKPLNDTFRDLELERLNGDGKVDIVDFSLMAYYWTG